MNKCLTCNKTFIPKKGNTGKYCCSICWLKSDEHKLIYRKTFKGNHLTDKHKQKLSLAKLGKKQSPKQISKRLFWVKGYHWKSSTIAKRSKSLKGKTRSGLAYINILNGIAKSHGYSSYQEMPHDKDYNNGFRKIIRPKILNRDNHTCQKCGLTKRLQIHHIDGNKRNDNSENLITLCIFCHQRLKGFKYKL